MTKKEARAIGIDTGYGIGDANIPNFGPDEFDSYMDTVLETESEHYRQFSPFEFTAAEFNKDEDRADGLWEAYEAGLVVGLKKAWSRFRSNAAVAL